MTPDFAAFRRELFGRRAAPIDNLVCLPTVPSTNTLGRRIAGEYLKEEMPLPTVLIVAFEQTAGRGRWGRSWLSPPGQGIYASLAMPLAGGSEMATLPLLAAVGLAQTINRHLAAAGSRPCRLKWPNDLVVGGRKLAGILIDGLSEGDEHAAVVGFGVNHGQSEEELVELAPPSDAGAGPTSLRIETTSPPPLAELLWELVEGLQRQLGHLGDAAYAARGYSELSVHRPGDPLRCRAGEDTIEGTFLGFDLRGHLRLEVAGEEIRIAAGEVR